MQRSAPNSSEIAARIRSDAARKPTVLAIHGTASSGRKWQALAERLEGAAQAIALGLWRAI